MAFYEIIDCELSIENYTLTRLDRNRHGGGLLVYVHASLNWEILLEGSVRGSSGRDSARDSD